MVDRRDDVWAAHPVWAGAVRVAVVLVPLVLSVVAGIVVARRLPIPESLAGRIGWFVVAFAASSLVLYLSDRAARRVLPLAVLLELSLVFPDRAPSRLRSVRTASVRDLEDRLARLRAQGATTPPIEAAETLVTLVGILGLHDRRTRGHSERVRAFVDLLTDEMGLPEDDRVRIRWAALVHDLGKLTIPAGVLNKTTGLDDDEWDAVRRHPDEGVRLVAGFQAWLGEWGRAIGEHHERWDGLGYPAGLAGEDIGLGARIVAVADSYEVMTSARSYNKARGASAARKELTVCAGAQFDPHVVRSFLSISLGRLRWVAGPVTWLAQVPFVALDGIGQAARLGTAAAGLGGLAATGALTAPSPPPVAAAPPPAVSVSPLPVGALLPSPTAAIRSASPLPSPLVGTPRPSPARTAAARTPAPVARSVAPAPATAPVMARTWWFSGAGTLSPSLPAGSGPPPDVDRDRRPGRTVVPAAAGLDATRAAERLVLSLDVPRTTRLVGAPTVVLWSRLADRAGNARVQVRLQDCGPASCTTLSEGQVVDGTWSPGATFVAHDVELAAVDVTVRAGHRLRLTVVAHRSGTRSDLLVALGTRSAPSRLVLPVRR